MFIVINKIIAYIERILNFLKNLTKFSLKQTYKNNLGFFKFKFFSNRATRYKFFLYVYILITMALCPFLDNLFTNWYNVETYNIYYILAFCFLLNYILNMLIVIPTKNTLNFKLLFLQIKSLYLYINNIFIKILKYYLFFKNEVFLKSFFLNFLKSNLSGFLNYFTY